MNTVTSVNEAELLRNGAGEVLCEFCGAVMEEWSPAPELMWYTCDWCGAVVLGATDEPVEPVAW